LTTKCKTPLQLTLAALLLVQLAPRHADAAPKPLKVFILAGQSNMDGQANVSTIDFLGEDPDKDRAALLKKFKPDGKTLVARDDVWVAHRGVYGNLGPGYGGRKSDDTLGSNIGPEYAFGYFMGEALQEQVLLIKTAGWLNLERDLKKNPITPEEQAMLKRATSNQGYHYFGEGRFFILLGKRFAETMLELLEK